MTSVAVAYNSFAYPSALFRYFHPERLAMIARLHGIAAPAIATCRVLEVGGSDGLNATAIAAAYPNAHCVNFDIASMPIERGRRIAEMAGIANVRHEVLDIMEAADGLDGPFDYIIAHGVYAWVPEPVREGLLAMIARLLSPNGVAYLSYDAFPGGHTRIALRELLLHHIGHIADPRQKIAAARATLQAFLAQPAEQAEPIIAAMRKEAEATLAKADGVIFHDELSSAYAPHAVLDVATAAHRHGLAYLSDAGRGRANLGFVDPGQADISEAALLHAIQGNDYARGRYFRSTLLVRAERQILRVIDVAAARSMWASTRVTPVADNRFKMGRVEVAVADSRIAAVISRLAAEWPAWLPVKDLVEGDEELLGLCQRAVDGFVDLYTGPPPFTLAPGERPVASPLARLQVAEGMARVCTLDHQIIELAEPALRKLLSRLDGSCDRASIEREGEGAALDLLAAKALLAA